MRNSVLEKIISLINIIEPKNIVYGPKIKPDILVLLNNLTNSTIKLLDPNDVSKGSIRFWWEGEEEEGGPLPDPPEWIGNAITIIHSVGDCDLMLLDANFYASMNESVYNKVKYVILFDDVILLNIISKASRPPALDPIPTTMVLFSFIFTSLKSL